METLKRLCFGNDIPNEKARDNHISVEPEPFSLPAPMPQWPQGGGFAKGRIQLGELELFQISKFEKIWSCMPLKQITKGATFYKPIGVPNGFSIFGHYCQSNRKSLHGFVLAVRETTCEIKPVTEPALRNPVDYELTWNSSCSKKETNEEDTNAYFWVPCAPEGYKAMGILVTKNSDKPSLDETVCVRSDLTDNSEIHNLVLDIESISSEVPQFRVWTTRPSHRGMNGRGIPVGTFFCTSCKHNIDNKLNSLVCLKNLDLELNAMPKLHQIHALIQHYGPMMFFHPKETFLPSSVSWFFENGANLHSKGESNSDAESIVSDGSNLPPNGQNDCQYWIDLPTDKTKKYIKFGNLQSAKLYCHVKQVYGGTFTDIAMWIFCPFNGPGTVKIGTVNISLGKIGQHVGDWEHFTLRISNFNGELWRIYYSQHSGGIWVDTPELEFHTDNKAVIYSSKNGHASYPRGGLYLQGSQAIGIGIRNDAERSDLVLDSSEKYEIVAAEYLGDEVAEPDWLQYMREWGPKVVYDYRREVDRIIGYLPIRIRCSLERFFNLLPCELYKEEGPTGPKEKNNWFGDERW